MSMAHSKPGILHARAFNQNDGLRAHPVTTTKFEFVTPVIHWLAFERSRSKR